MVEDQAGQTSRVSTQRHQPMRVCVVSYSLYETDSRARRYAESLAQRGDSVDVFALGRPGAAKTETFHGVRVRRLQERTFSERGRFSYAWRYLLFLIRALVQVSIEDFRHRYDVVHVHSVPDFMVFSALVPRMRGTPIILDIRDILPEFYASKFGVSDHSPGFRFLCFVERISAGLASHVIIANPTWQARILKRSVRSKGCSVVFNLPDRSIFVKSGKKDQNHDRFLLLYHGTLNWHQGLDLAIRAFAQIHEMVPDVDFHIYGDGPVKDELLNLVNELHLENRVTIRERRPLQEIPPILETAKLGIVPKRNDRFGREAFSTKTLEYMAMGVPVLLADTAGDLHYFDAKVVQFFKAEDIEDMSQKMLDLIQHPEKRYEIIDRAARFVADRDWETKKSEYLALVDGLVADARKGSETRSR